MSTSTETSSNSRRASTSTDSSPRSRRRRFRRALARTSFAPSPPRRGSPNGCSSGAEGVSPLAHDEEPTWQNVNTSLSLPDIVDYSAPKKKKVLTGLDEVDPEVRATFDKLGIPIEEQKLFAA